MLTFNFNRFSLEPGARVLDIGCGEGRHIVRAGQEQGTICTGADYVFDNLLTSRNKLNFHQAVNDLKCRDWNLSAMDVTRLPFGDHTFDLVLCAEVLEHIPDHETAVEELIRIVKPGKTLAVSVPSFWPEKICWTLSKEYTRADMGHVRIYKKSQLIRQFTSRGLVFTGTHRSHAIHTPYWWLKCLAGVNRTDSVWVNLYHRFLVWDLMKRPWISAFADRLLNPLLGKSLVLYFRCP